MSCERGVLLIIKRGCLAKRGGCLLPNLWTSLPNTGQLACCGVEFADPRTTISSSERL
jgi:hypothetical protein